MDYFLPSEIGRLVLGYLKEEHCKESYQTFLHECVHLREYAALLRRGREFPTKIADKTLKDILNDYGLQRESQLKSRPVECLWLKHDSLISQLKGRYMPSRQHLSAQACRAKRGIQMNSLVGTDNCSSPSAQDAEGEEDGTALPSPLGAVEVDSDLDPHTLVVEAPQARPFDSPTLPLAASCQQVHKMSPNVLGGVPVDVSTGQATCRNSTASTSPQPSCSGRASTWDTPASVRSSRSKVIAAEQENSFTNHQRESPVKLRTLRSRAVKKSNETNSSKKPSAAKPVKKASTAKTKRGKKRVSLENEVAKPCDDSVHDSAMQESDDCRRESDSSAAACVTPKKFDVPPSTIAIGKSPRRKCPVPKRRSGCQEEVASSNLSATPAVPTISNTSDNLLSMPVLDDLINNTHFVNKLANTINQAKHGIEPGGTDIPEKDVPEEHTPTPTSKIIEPAKKRRKQSVSFNACADPIAIESDDSIGNVVSFEDDAMTQEAVKSFIEMTKTDPECDLLYQLFTNYPKSTSEVIEPATPTTDDMPVIKVTKMADSDVTTDAQTVQVVYESPDGSTDFVETVQLEQPRKGRKAKQGKTTTRAKKTPKSMAKKALKPRKLMSNEKMSPTAPDGTETTTVPDAAGTTVDTAAIKDPDFPFKVPLPPRTETASGRTSEPREDKDPASDSTLPKLKQGHGGSRRKKLIPLGIVSKRSCANPGGSDISATSATSLGTLQHGVLGASVGQGSVVDLGHIQLPAAITLVTPNDQNTVAMGAAMEQNYMIQDFRRFTPISHAGVVYQDASITQPQPYLPHADPHQGVLQTTLAQHANPPPQMQAIQSQQVQFTNLQPAMSQPAQWQQQTLTQSKQCGQMTYQMQQVTNCSSTLPLHLTECSAATSESGQWVSDHSYMNTSNSTTTTTVNHSHETQLTNTGLFSTTANDTQATVVQSETMAEQTLPTALSSSNDDFQLLQSQQQQVPLTVTSQSLPAAQPNQLAPDMPSIVAAAPPSLDKAGGRTLSGKTGGHTPLSSSGACTPLQSSSPFYSNPETPGLGAHEVIDLNSPVAVSPYSAMSANLQPQQQAITPINCKPPVQETGSARTRCHWLQYKNRRKTLLAQSPMAVLTLPGKGGGKELDSAVKENTTPDKASGEGSRTPLHTKEVQVAETLVAMAASPVKGPAVTISQFPTANAPAALCPSDRDPSEMQTTRPAPSVAPANEAPAIVEHTFKTPAKRKPCRPTGVSPECSVLLDKLIQVSAGVLLNGHGDSSGTPSEGPRHARKRLLNSKRPGEPKKLKLDKVDMDKFLEKLHPSS